MPTHPHPQGPVAVERIELAFDGLPDELDVQSSFDSGWITISYREQIVARYLPVRQIAELDIQFVVDGTGVCEDEPDDVTCYLIDALSALQGHGFTICHEYAEEFGNGCFRQSLVLRNRPVTEEEMLEIVPMVLDASQFAVDKAVDQKTAQIGSD